MNVHAPRVKEIAGDVIGSLLKIRTNQLGETEQQPELLRVMKKGRAELESFAGMPDSLPGLYEACRETDRALESVSVSDAAGEILVLQGLFRAVGSYFGIACDMALPGNPTTQVILAAGANAGLCGFLSEANLQWEFENFRGRQLFTKPLENSAAQTIGFDLLGKRLAVGMNGFSSSDRRNFHEIKIFSIPDGNDIWGTRPTEGFVNVVALSPNGMYLTAGIGYNCCVWKVGIYKTRWTGELALPPSAIAFTPDGTRVVGAGRGEWSTRWREEPILAMWEALSGKELWHLPARDEMPTSLDVSPNGKLLAVGFESPKGQGKIAIFETSMGKPRWDESCPLTIRSVAFDRDGLQISTMSWDQKAKNSVVEIRNAETGKPTEKYVIEDQLAQLFFFPDGKLHGLGGRGFGGNAFLRIWQINDKEEIWNIHRPGFFSEVISTEAITRDGKHVATGSNQSISVWH